MISLRGYVETLFNAHKRVHELEAQELARQAKEYERRLTELNHAHEKAAADKDMFLQKDPYDAAVKEIRGLIDVNERAVIKVDHELRALAERMTVLSTTITWLGRAILGALLAGAVTLMLRSFNLPLPSPLTVTGP